MVAENYPQANYTQDKLSSRWCSGSWGSRITEPKATELFVPSWKLREAADNAIAAWGMESISVNN